MVTHALNDAEQCLKGSDLAAEREKALVEMLVDCLHALLMLEFEDEPEEC